MIITRRSPVTKTMNDLEVDITQDQYEAWQEGELIQNAMPNLTPDEREFLITGMTPEDWAKVFG